MPVAGLAGGVDGADGVVVFPAGGDVVVGVGGGGGVEFGQGLPGGEGIPPDSELVAYGAGHGVPRSSMALSPAWAVSAGGSGAVSMA